MDERRELWEISRNEQETQKHVKRKGDRDLKERRLEREM